MTSPKELRKEYRKVVFASVFGTIIEWYDFLIYGTAAALVFNKLFFPLILWSGHRRNGSGQWVTNARNDEIWKEQRDAPATACLFNARLSAKKSTWVRPTLQNIID
jgi:hypothetical protein